MWLEISFIFALIVLLYGRTYKHKWVIDDICVRADYLTKHTEEYAAEEKERKFQNLRRAWWITPESIIIHTISCIIIYIIWGYHPALLFAVFPLNVHAVAWATGMRLYGTATMLVLICQYLSGWGAIALGFATINLFTALHVAISPMFYPFYKLFTGSGLERWLYFVPLALFLGGKRFRHGIKKRVDSHHNLNVADSGNIKWKRIIIVPKVMGWYALKTIYPKAGFFSEAQWYLHNYAIDKWFWSLTTLFIMFSGLMFMVDPNMAIWWLCSIGIFCQFFIFGQFTSPRYTILSNVAWCVIISKILDPYPHAFTVLATLYAYKTWNDVKIWRNNLTLFTANSETDPLCPDAHNNAGRTFMDAGMPSQAITHWLLALKYGPINNNILLNLCQAYAKVADYDKAIIYGVDALKDCPQSKKKDLEDLLIILQNKKRKMYENQKLFKKMMRE